MRVEVRATAVDGVRLWPAYQAIFGDYPTYAGWRDAVWDKHRVRDGFRLGRGEQSHNLGRGRPLRG